MLAIGRALMGNPRVLLMDEPSEGLAPQIVAEVMATIRKLKDSGLSIVLVEQNPKLVFDIADDIVILNSGHVAVVVDARPSSTATASTCASIWACFRNRCERTDRTYRAMADMWNKYEPTAARKARQAGPRDAAEEPDHRHACPCRRSRRPSSWSKPQARYRRRFRWRIFPTPTPRR